MTNPDDSNSQKLALVRELASFEGGRVLDVGCGDGAVSLLMARHAASVVGVDPDEAAIGRALASAAERGEQRVSFHATDVRAVDFREEAFDLVLFMRSL